MPWTTSWITISGKEAPISYQELLNRYGSPAKTNDHTIYLHFQAPDSLATPKEVAYRDGMTEKDIARLEWYLERMKDYRQALALRYAQLETMSYTYRLKLRRYVCCDSRKEYILTITKILEDGAEITELREVYPGRERHKAIARYEALKKARPGITAEMDIEKGRWEK